MYVFVCIMCICFLPDIILGTYKCKRDKNIELGELSSGMEDLNLKVKEDIARWKRQWTIQRDKFKYLEQ